ncbi:uncharacterized protein [Argopecten irradians]|uniref:uncharacterized protein n=1 Tax=Argopecten irradians TaxID=31199 RepID=UPI0037232145
MILEMICEMKKVFLAVVVFLCFVNVSAQNPYPPTIWKRKLIFVSVRTSWYDASHYCHSNHSGLMDDTSEATKEMIKFYKDSDLHWKPHDFNSDYWFGMYLTDPHTLEYIWEGSCEIINATLFERFKDGIPVDASDLDITKRCGFAQKGDSKWDWDDCALANTFTSVCQENTGPCFFERDTHQGACTKGSDESWIVTTTTRDECEEYCRQMMARSVEKGECWAVTYINSSQTCLPSVHEEPLRFEASTGEYHVSCSENLVTDRGLDSFVSWKRCYDEPEVVGSIPSANEDAPTCFPLTTTTTTTATATETSTTTTATSTIPTTSTATSTTTLPPTTTSTSTVPPTTTSTSTVPPTTTSTSTVPPTTTSTSTVPPTTTSTSTVPPTTTSTSTVPPTTTSTSTVPQQQRLHLRYRQQQRLHLRTPTTTLHLRFLQQQLLHLRYRQQQRLHLRYRQQQRLHLRYLQQQRLHLRYRQQQRLHLRYRQQQRLHLRYRQQQRLHLRYRQQQRLHLRYRQQQRLHLRYRQQQRLHLRYLQQLLQLIYHQRHQIPQHHQQPQQQLHHRL